MVSAKKMRLLLVGLWLINNYIFHINHMKQSTLSRSLDSVHPAPLATYLAGAVGSTLLLAAPQAEAAVTAVDFGFGPVLSAASGYTNYTTPTTPNLGTIFADANIFSDWMMGTQTTVRLGGQFSGWNQGTFYQQRSSYGAATFLADGAVVGGGGNGNLGMAYFAAQRSFLNIDSDQLNKNLGFQTSTGNWGWANVSWDATAKALTFNSAYVESLAGLAGVALRRRRKQAV
jgi:hypothetical protein